MLAKISLLTSLAFSFLYPLAFWISYKNPLKNNFHHFHTATPNIIGGIVCVFLLRGNYPQEIKTLAIIWFILSFCLTCYYWRKETIQIVLYTIPSFVGAFLFFKLLDSQTSVFLISILGNIIFCLSLYAMNLGHWYLNVHGLSMEHLKRSSFILFILICLRGLWDIVYLCVGEIVFDGDIISVSHFLMTMEGLFILVGVAFGILLPLVALVMVREILKLKNTQATTGILYVILCGVILADLIFKYYLFQYGILM